MKLCFIDTETTGLDPKKNRIWQIGGTIRVDGKIKKTFCFTEDKVIVDPSKEKRLYTEFTKMLDNHVNKFNKQDKLFFVGYNADFDTDFIREMFLRNKNNFYGSYFHNPSIDVMQMGALYFLKRPKIKRPDNFKLGTLCKYFKVPFNESKAHNADYDAEITRKLYNKLIKK